MPPDEPAAVVETAAAAEPAQTPAPESEAPAAEPAAEATEAVAEAVVEEAAAEPKAPAAEPAADKTPSLLSGAGKKGEEPAKATEPAAEPVEPAEPAEPEPIAYEAFKLPEDIKPDEERIAAYTELLGRHRAPQELGQELIDLHIAEVRNLQKRMEEHQREVWDRTQEQWIDTVRRDREIGGNRLNTVLAQCGEVIDRYGTPGLRDALSLTGAGNNPDMVRFVYNVAKALAPPKPIPASRPAPAPQSRAQRRYSSNGSAAP